MAVIDFAREALRTRTSLYSVWLTFRSGSGPSCSYKNSSVTATRGTKRAIPAGYPRD